MVRYVAIPTYQFNDLAPETGTHVCFLYGAKLRLYAGIVVNTDNISKWGVKIPSGKILYPYLSDVYKMGCSLKNIKSTIEEI